MLDHITCIRVGKVAAYREIPRTKKNRTRAPTKKATPRNHALMNSAAKYPIITQSCRTAVKAI